MIIQEAYRQLVDELKDDSRIQAIGIGDTGDSTTSFLCIYLKKRTPKSAFPSDVGGFTVKVKYIGPIIVQGARDGGD